MQLMTQLSLRDHLSIEQETLDEDSLAVAKTQGLHCTWERHATPAEGPSYLCPTSARPRGMFNCLINRHELQNSVILVLILQQSMDFVEKCGVRLRLPTKHYLTFGEDTSSW